MRKACVCVSMVSYKAIACMIIYYTGVYRFIGMWNGGMEWWNVG